MQLAIGLHSLCFLNSKMRHHLFVSLFLSFPTDGHGLMGAHLLWQSSSLALYYQMETSTQISHFQGPALRTLPFLLSPSSARAFYVVYVCIGVTNKYSEIQKKKPNKYSGVL